MKTKQIVAISIIVVLAVVIGGVWYQSRPVQTPESTDTNLPRSYVNNKEGFSIKLPADYTIDESYVNQLSPQKKIGGVKFTISPSLATGTNLAQDSYISVEKIPDVQSCSANMFIDDTGAAVKSITENGTQYSVASTTGAGAGNRYEETIYALPSTNPCVAVHYLIHYGVIENYPTGAVREFDKQALLRQFDDIRKTLVVL